VSFTTASGPVLKVAGDLSVGESLGPRPRQQEIRTLEAIELTDRNG
jgi:hypothetical protein